MPHELYSRQKQKFIRIAKLYARNRSRTVSPIDDTTQEWCIPFEFLLAALFYIILHYHTKFYLSIYSKLLSVALCCVDNAVAQGVIGIVALFLDPKTLLNYGLVCRAAEDALWQVCILNIEYYRLSEMSSILELSTQAPRTCQARLPISEGLCRGVHATVRTLLYGSANPSYVNTTRSLL